jgi:hypothetical protein
MSNVVKLKRKFVLPLGTSQKQAAERINAVLTREGLSLPVHPRHDVDPRSLDAILCESCGKHEYVDQHFCRCGADFRRQLKNQYNEAEIARKRFRILRVRRFMQISRRCFLSGVLLFLAFYGAPLIAPSVHSLGYIISTIFMMIVGTFSASLHYERKAKAEKKKIRGWSLDEYIDALRHEKMSRAVQE